MTQAQGTHTRGCLYQQLDNGIHEFVFTGEGNTGLDEMFDVLEGIMGNSTPDDTLCYIVDSTRSKSDTSLKRMVGRFRDLQLKVPLRGKGRTAILHQGGLMVTLGEMMISALAPKEDKTRFFKPQDRDKAIEWLLSQK